jgi:hypothetical protein
LVLPTGLGTLLALVVAGAVGALGGLLLGGRSTLDELVELARSAVSR